MRYIVSGAGSRIGAWGTRGDVDNVKLVYRQVVMSTFMLNDDSCSYPKLYEVPLTSEFGFGDGGFVQLTLDNETARLRFYARDELEYEEWISRRQMDVNLSPSLL